MGAIDPAEAGPGAFDAFYAARFPDAVRLAHLLTGDASVAEDLAQEALTRVHGRFDALDDPWPYLRAAVVNACRSHHRRRTREWARVLLVAGGAPAAPAATGTAELLDAIDALPYRQKAVIVLRYYEDLAEATIADVLGCRPGTVKSLAARALARLARDLEPENRP